MDIGILGSGTVGRTLGARLRQLGHRVALGSRDAAKPEARAWAAAHGALSTDFAGAAAAGSLLVNATAGSASLDALRAAGEPALGNKVLLDVANPLDFSGGYPPTLTVANRDSLGEQIQRAFPRLRVVKALNTVTAAVMVDPAGIGAGVHDVFLAGEDAGAKAQAGELLASFGWRPERIRDLGGIDAARGLEMYLPLWIRLTGLLGTAQFNIRIVGTDPQS
ncbi:NADPH-dependent F420 reductase [Sinomonas mesophila]|uniref:NADPH-dependent F420 reductase n=1 Tax=Sinomonas mesophila TaxID=1531955 RepID=UPI0009858E37|nr:NAD(P)-binding domain-containing protein [Sinomonas mesophila]